MVAVVDQLHRDAYVVAEFKRGHRVPETVFVLLPCLVNVGTSKGGGFHEEGGAAFRRGDHEVGLVTAAADLGLEGNSRPRASEGSMDFEL
ncbi:hypothetical protein AVL48_04540 [Amycolatopsis regifaucium]|uniref:Uncharacterized protein n=1 Tax=Amycolatopsis regifaucium TaxID=546365 RepID=A0A154MG43_9PSEU|nr:hypothetical protein AVL48_04540 [Amycolatopsis regifaucium]OKA08876.1 hypothetical protein ATP06_0211005 [Amycolatopsis regifaucium]